MILDLLKQFTQLTDDEILSAANKASTTYKRYSVQKHKDSKAKRVIYQPARTTKMLQYGLLGFFEQYQINNRVAFAYQKGLSAPLRQNAKKHVNYNYSLHLDIQDFFPSISSSLLFSQLDANPSFVKLSTEDKSLIEKICFLRTVQGMYLTIGAPTSPIISNIVLIRFDEYFEGYCMNREISYSRYADDLWFSADVSTLLDECKREVLNVFSEMYDNQFQLNETKTRINHLGESRFITGLVVSANGQIQIPRRIKRYVRALLHKPNLDADERQKLCSYIGYIRQNEPTYLNNLILKYGKEYFEKIDGKKDSKGL